jgi:hypothetical protein
MFDKLFKNEFKQKLLYDLKYDDTLEQFIVIDRDFNNCCDKVIISGFSKDQLLKIASSFNNWLSKQIIGNNKHYFVVIGQYPNLVICEKIFIYKDNYRYCLKDMNANSIDLYQNNRVFETYQKANNKIIELLQQKDSNTLANNYLSDIKLMLNNDIRELCKSQNKETKSKKRGK